MAGRTFNSDLLPAQVGLALGSEAQPWDVHSQNHTFLRQISRTSPSASVGTISFGAGDSIAWRNNADTDDLVLSLDSSDVITWPGFIKAAGLISTSPDIPTTGTIRLGALDSITTRNVSSASDMNLLSKDSLERVIVGSTSGSLMYSLQSQAAVPQPSQTGFLRLGNTEQINWRNSSNTDDEGLSVDNSDRLTLNTINGFVLLGSNPDISFGATDNTAPKLRRDVRALSLVLADESDYAPFVSGDTEASVFSTRSSSVVDLSTQSASIGNTALPTLPQGMYQITYYISVSRAASSSSSILATFTWPSGDSPGTVTGVTGTLNSNTLGDYKSGVIVCRIPTGSLTYSTTYASSGGTSLLYHLTFKAIRIS